MIFVFNSWQFSKPNIIRIFEYFCTNISEYWSLKITWNTWIKEFYFPFLTWRYILTTLLITMIISFWSINPLNTGHLCKAELSMLFWKIFHLSITNYSKIFEYSNILNYSNIIWIYFTVRIIFITRFKNVNYLTRDHFQTGFNLSFLKFCQNGLYSPISSNSPNNCD